MVLSLHFFVLVATVVVTCVVDDGGGVVAVVVVGGGDVGVDVLQFLVVFRISNLRIAFEW